MALRERIVASPISITIRPYKRFDFGESNITYHNYGDPCRFKQDVIDAVEVYFGPICRDANTIITDDTLRLLTTICPAISFEQCKRQPRTIILHDIRKIYVRMSYILNINTVEDDGVYLKYGPYEASNNETFGLYVSKDVIELLD